MRSREGGKLARVHATYACFCSTPSHPDSKNDKTRQYPNLLNGLHYTANMTQYIEGDEPTVSILLLGDDEVGKSTFLSYVFLTMLLTQYLTAGTNPEEQTTSRGYSRTRKHPPNNTVPCLHPSHPP